MIECKSSLNMNNIYIFIILKILEVPAKTNQKKKKFKRKYLSTIQKMFTFKISSLLTPLLLLMFTLVCFHKTPNPLDLGIRFSSPTTLLAAHIFIHLLQASTNYWLHNNIGNFKKSIS